MKEDEEAAAAKEVVLSSWSPADQKSALEKVQRCAALYDRRAIGPAGLAAFDGNDMAPELFARMFYRTFGVRLSEREVGALVSYFDADGDGMVDSSEFVAMFFRMKMRSRIVNPQVPDNVVHGPKGGGGWTSAMPPLGRPTTTAVLFRPNDSRAQTAPMGASGSLRGLRGGGSLRAGGQRSVASRGGARSRQTR